MFLIDPTIFLWDLLILLSITTLLALAICCSAWVRAHRGTEHEKLSQRGMHYLRYSTVSLCGLLFATGFTLVMYAAFIEPRTLVVTEHEISLPVQSPLKIAVISDIHVGPYKGRGYLRRVVQETNRLLPDFVFLVGDFVSADDTVLADLLPLKNLRASAGVYAVMGNHDQGQMIGLNGQPLPGIDRGEDITAMLERLDVRVLRNAHRVVNLGTEKITVAGIDDLWTGFGDVAGALADAPPETATILLSHNPSVIDDPATADVDLVVSGHTHGGQLRLPGIGALPTLPISIDQSYDQGVFPLQGRTTLAITRGVGESWMRARFLAWPEIMVLNVRQP